MADALENYETKKWVPTWLKPLPFDGYTFKDFMSWDEDIRVELIDGIPYMMSSPSIEHQRLAKDLTRQLDTFFEGKACEALPNVGVRLYPTDDETDKITTIPDIVVVCDKKKLKDSRAVKGAPDFVIEILSPGDRGRDLITKKDHYEEAGVKEYWVIDQVKHNKLYKYLLQNGIYTETIIDFTKETKIPVSVFPGCVLEIKNEQ